MSDHEAITKALTMMSEAGELGEGWKWLGPDHPLVPDSIMDQYDVGAKIKFERGRALATYAILMGSWWLNFTMDDNELTRCGSEWRVVNIKNIAPVSVSEGPDPLASLCRARLGVEG